MKERGPRIAIDGRPFIGGYSGYTTYLESIILPLIGAGWQVTLLTNKPLNPIHVVQAQCEVAMFGSERPSLWEQLSVPEYLRSHEHEVYLVGTNKGLPWRKHRRTTYVLGLLDIIPYKFPRAYLTRPGYWLRELRPVAQLISVLRTDRLVSISECSAQDIQKLFHRHATPLLLRLEREAAPKPPAEPKPQFVYVGGVDGRKRIGELLRAFAEFHAKHSTFRLVLIGKGYAEHYGDLMDELHIRDAIELTGFVDQATKLKIMSESTALVYPSQYEGYGLAIAEGFMADVPVVAGPGGSQAEVGGEAVFYIDPLDPASIAEGMRATLRPEVRQQLAKARQIQSQKLFGPQVEQAIITYFNGLVRS